MQISIAGHHISLCSSLQEYVKKRTTEVIQKYFEHAISAAIHFSKQGFQVVCEVVVNDGTGRHVIIKSDASSDEIYSAFDIAAVKLEKQLRKYKSKINDHHNKIKASLVGFEATKYIIRPYADSEEENNAEGNPVIIAEQPIEVLPLSVSEAVMKMDLENFPALMFQNANTGRINVVYYRRDGNISWVDSKK